MVPKWTLTELFGGSQGHLGGPGDMVRARRLKNLKKIMNLRLTLGPFWYLFWSTFSIHFWRRPRDSISSAQGPHFGGFWNSFSEHFRDRLRKRESRSRRHGSTEIKVAAPVLFPHFFASFFNLYPGCLSGRILYRFWRILGALWASFLALFWSSFSRP